MTLALFDIFENEGNHWDDVDQSHHSILKHLSWLLNSRQGSLHHLPDYGLPDVTEIYRSLPYSMTKLTTAMEKTIRQYEPRLKNVSVTQQNSDDYDCVLHFKIVGHCQMGEILSFNTYFTASGQAEIYLPL